LKENHSIYKYFPGLLSLEKKYITNGRIFLWPFLMTIASQNCKLLINFSKIVLRFYSFSIIHDHWLAEEGSWSLSEKKEKEASGCLLTRRKLRK
jgi:hypothetical protein